MSVDSDGTITLYEWDWESDNVYDCNTTSPEVMSHSYEEPGLYNVTLRVTDNDGLTHTATATKA
jgi:PKD repeat protein